MNTIISIGRQFGSGGRDVGIKLAKKMGIEFFDKELITMAAKEIGFDPSMFEKVDERSSGFNVLVHSVEEFLSGGFPSDNYLSSDMLFKVQSDVIRKIAEDKKSCVIVGRCSDYVLRDYPNCISVFLHSSFPDRIKRVCERMQLTESKAQDLIRQTDKRRAHYYNYYSNKIWGQADTYHLSINVSALGEDGTVNLIESFVNDAIAKIGGR